VICNVANCRYEAVSTVQDFPVCALHDGRHVEAMLENLQRPGHFWSPEGPIVLPVGALAVEHFEPKEGDGKDPGTCLLLSSIDFERHRGVLPKFDLLKEWLP